MLMCLYVNIFIESRNSQERVRHHWGIFRKQKIAPVASHPKPYEKQSTEGETPLGHFSKTENCPSGVSHQTIRETVNRR